METLVAVGGGAAGMSASSRARRLKPDMEIVVFESTKMVSHAPCGIPYFVEGLFNDENLFMTYTPQFFEEKRKIHVKTNTKVTEIDFDSRIVYGESREGKIKAEYDYLVISTGAIPRKIPVEDGNDRIFYAHHPANAVELRERLWSLNTIAIVGGGILGIEMAEALTHIGKKVILIHRSKYLLNKTIDTELGNIITQRVSKDAEVRLNESVETIKEGGRLIVTDKGKYQVDGTIIAIGVAPNVELVKDKIKLGETGAIKVDDHMRTNYREVYSAGDNTESVNIITKKPAWVPFAPVANKMGYVAGSNIGGHEMRFPGVVNTQITKYKEFYIGRVGLQEDEARLHGFKPISATISGKTRARYYPDAKDIHVKIIADENTKRILGAQIVGGEEVLGRIDMMAAAIMKGFTIEDTFFIEMGYLPAISRVWDPVIVAIRQLMKDE
ncbi:FAD-dependent oxidoreductase [Sulfurisphaera tokodaii]|uniref:NADH oxidase n=2 Tax=Sulfurisphaera tokodaii TaxID=111955 RepID=Q96YC0_SULTO|nr:FAD-dependent oxidoreductase [Sulfurisphaera tokodaii]BAB67357.1 NADH oxidase [Sulfurisphaera tokodaii str. 7]HII73167.1 FAD-dependent oxidoreductase [Sulfurisphaera tokodaii]